MAPKVDIVHSLNTLQGRQRASVPPPRRAVQGICHDNLFEVANLHAVDAAQEIA